MIRPIGQGEAGQIIFAEAEESESMIEQLGCTCGFVAKIEEALERILEACEGSINWSFTNAKKLGARIKQDTTYTTVPLERIIINGGLSPSLRISTTGSSITVMPKSRGKVLHLKTFASLFSAQLRPSGSQSLPPRLCFRVDLWEE